MYRFEFSMIIYFPFNVLFFNQIQSIIDIQELSIISHLQYDRTTVAIFNAEDETPRTISKSYHVHDITTEVSFYFGYTQLHIRIHRQMQHLFQFQGKNTLGNLFYFGVFLLRFN